MGHESKAQFKVAANVSDQSVAENRVLVLAPSGNDARLTKQVLGGARIQAKICREVPDLCREMDGQCAAIILAEETLKASSLGLLVANLARQPPWSDLPLIIITSGGEADKAKLRRTTVFGPGSNVTLLERPFRPGTLISCVEAALRSRKRQYQVRELLREVSSARDAAEEANRAKDDFLAALSHELRTPLSPVLLLATDAAADESVPAPLRADFESIAKNVTLEARLIDDLLDLTRITRGKLVLDLRTASLHGIIRDAIDNVMPEMLEKELRLTVNFCEGSPQVQCDPVRLQQVFWNVLKNAAKFTNVRGEISVRTWLAGTPGGETVAVGITDSGIGMNRGEIERIFEAFSQGDHAGKGSQHRFGGLGLGLAISRSLVDLHHGNIRASSTGIGTGSTFTIELPLTSSSQVAFESCSTPPAIMAGKARTG